MNEEEYFKQRVETQIKWYDDKSTTNKKWFKFLRFIEILCAATIPFLAGFSEKIECSEFYIGSLGIIIAICAGLSSLNKNQENWLVYRTTAETLKHEKYLFLTKSKPYEDTSGLQLFVQRFESLISKENSQWSQHTKKEST